MNNKSLLPTLLMAVSVAVILTGCCPKKDNTATSDKPITALRMGLAKLNIEDQKELFYYMPADIKNSLWTDRIDEVMQTNITAGQKELLQDMQRHLQPALFDTTMASSEQRTTFAAYLTGWKANAQKAFAGADSVKLNEMMAGLGSPNNAPRIMQGAPPIPDCDCNSASSACNCVAKPTAKCHMVNTGFPWYVWYNGLCK